MSAAKAGRRFYLGRPCQCGSSVRYTTNASCVVCAKDRAVSYNSKIRDALRAADGEA